MKIIRLNKSKCLTITVILLMLFSQLSVFLFTTIPSVNAHPDWLSGWEYRKSHILLPTEKSGTRFYFPSSGYTPVSPAFSGDWERTADATRMRFDISKGSSVMASKTSSETVSTSPYDVLTRQYVSDPIKAQTIAGTVKGQMLVLESAVAADFCRGITIKVVSNDGATLRGVLLSHFPDSLTSEYPTTMANRNFPPESALSSVAAQEGDRIVVEIGTRAFNTATTQYIATHRFGDNAASDLPEDESTTTDSNPWIQFSQPIQFVTPSAGEDYQMKVVVWYGAGTDDQENVYLNGSCRTDFADIRFTRGDGVTELSYVPDEQVNGDYAIMWVKIADDLSAPTKEEYQETIDGAWATYGDFWTGQTFTPSKDFFLYRVTLNLRRYNDPAGDVIVSIKQTDASGKPIGDDILTKNMSASDIPTSNTNVDFIFSNFTIVTQNTKYAIVIRVPSGDWANYIVVNQNVASSYAGGDSCRSSDGGSSWTLYDGEDLFFQVWSGIGMFIYYGKSDATTTGDAKATFLMFYEFDTDETGDFASEFYRTAGTADPTRFNKVYDETSGNPLPSIQMDAEYVGAAGPAFEFFFVIVVNKTSSELAIKADYRAKSGFSGSTVTNSWVQIHPNETMSWDNLLWRYIYVAGGTYDTGWQDGGERYTNGAGSYDLIKVAFGGRDAWESEWNQLRWYDNIRVRKYVSPEPSHGGWGSEETFGVLYERFADQTLTILPVPSRQTSYIRPITQPLQILSETARLTSYSRFVSQLLDFVATATRQLTAIRTPEQQLLILTETSRQASYNRLIDQPLYFLTEALRWTFSSRSASQVLTILTEASRKSTLLRFADQPLTILLSASRKASYHRTAEVLLKINTQYTLKFIIYVEKPTPPPPVFPVPPMPTIQLDAVIQTAMVSHLWWKPTFTIEVLVINKGTVATDVTFEYMLLDKDNLEITRGLQTVFISGLDKKTVYINVPTPPDGSYTIHFSSTYPVKVEAKSALTVATPFYGRLEFTLLLISLLVVSIFAISKKLRKKL